MKVKIEPNFKYEREAKRTYLLELELVDGYGESSSYYYYLAVCVTPVRDGELTEEALADLEKAYPEEKRIGNSGYHHWRVVANGNNAQSLYNEHRLVQTAIADLRKNGIHI